MGGSGHLGLCRHQFGNKQCVSTAHDLLNLMDVLFQRADKPKNIGTVVLTDFSKDFDLLNHFIAIQKLIHLEIRGLLFHGFVVFCMAVNSVCAMTRLYVRHKSAFQ